MTEINKNESNPETTSLWVTYVLYLLVFPAVIGFFITLIKGRPYRRSLQGATPEAAQTAGLLATHHQWLFRTFIAALFLFMAAAGTLYYGVGYFLAIAAGVWWFYRTIRGIVRLAEHKPMPIWG